MVELSFAYGRMVLNFEIKFENNMSINRNIVYIIHSMWPPKRTPFQLLVHMVK